MSNRKKKRAVVAELADAPDSNPGGAKAPCEFNSHQRHQTLDAVTILDRATEFEKFFDRQCPVAADAVRKSNYGSLNFIAIAKYIKYNPQKGEDFFMGLREYISENAEDIEASCSI